MIFYLALVLVLNACGGGESDDGDDGSESSSQRASGDTEAETSSATVTIGDTIYQFTIDIPNQCNTSGPALFGTFAIDADGNAMEGGDASRAVALSFNMPAAGGESTDAQPPSIGVADSTRNEHWQAGGLSGSSGVELSESEVTSLEVGDGWAKGTAMFTDLTAHFAGQDKEAQSGSFDITCATS